MAEVELKAQAKGMAALRRFWIRLAGGEIPVGFRMGCGITAFTRDDALGLLLTVWPALEGDPVIVDVTEDVDLTTLDQNHVLPNVGDVTRRGVWFPNFG
ncbi:MAG: hypothetical protein AB7Q23_00965 [Hyphomonadaceae bacterium]